LFGGGIANAFSLHLEDLIRAVIKHAAVKQDQGAGAGLVVYGGDSSSSSVTEPGRAVAGLDRWTEYQRKSRSGTLCL